jgi:hypothetical protein
MNAIQTSMYRAGTPQVASPGAECAFWAVYGHLDAAQKHSTNHLGQTGIAIRKGATSWPP